MHSKSVLTLALAMVVATGGFAAMAAPNEAIAEAAALGAVTVSVTDAIAAVEAKGTGKVVELALLHEGNVAVYHVTTLLPDGTETNYAVDATTGAVVATVDVGQGEDGEQADGRDQDDGNGGDGDGDVQDGAN